MSGMCWVCFRHVSGTFRTCFGHDLAMCWVRVGHIVAMVRRCFGNVSGMS